MSWVAAAVVGTGLVTSAVSDRRARKAQQAANRTANAQLGISQSLFDESDPLRQALIGRSEQFLGVPGADGLSGMLSGMGGVMNSPSFLAFKEATGDTFGQARENTLSRLPAGGALLESLAGLEGQQASTLSQGAGQIYDNELARAHSLATGQLPVAMGGFGSAANAQSINASSLAQQSSAKSDATGQAAGAYLGSK